jgi:uncharacterized protein (DUF924 family)
VNHHLAEHAADPSAARVLRFWFGEAPQYGKRLKRWFEKDPAFDAEIAQNFLALYEEISSGGRGAWLSRAADCLARILVLDQFPRNMFRGTARAFQSDALALQAARHAVTHGYDLAAQPVERAFAYLPFEHSESLADQARACELIQPLAAFRETDDAYRYAIAHRDIVARFGRFPHRNAILGRASSAAELEFLKGPGSSF